MKQIPDDPIIRSMERTGYPPFMTRCLNKMVKNGSDDEIDWEDDEIDGENDRDERSIQTDQGRPFFACYRRTGAAEHSGDKQAEGRDRIDH